MRTTIVTFFVITVLLLGITKVQAQTSGTIGDLTWTISSDNTTLTISGSGAMPDFDWGTYAPYVETYSDYVTTVVIEEGVTSIGNLAFYGGGQLTSVTIPKSVTRIGDFAFTYSWKLTSVNPFPNVTYLGEGAFWGCANLRSITLPENITSIGRNAFYDCQALTSIIIPNRVTSIGEGAFNGCSSLASITIGSGITSIGQGAFSYCTTLSSITIPNNVTSIGHAAFRGCSSLYHVTIGNGVTSIASYAFLECSALVSLRILSAIPPSVVDFSGINQTSCILKVPIGAAATYRAAALWQNFTTINEIEDVASGTAGALTWVLTSDGTLTISGTGDMPNYSYVDNAPWMVYRNSITAVDIRYGVTSIGNFAFFYPIGNTTYPALKQVIIPNGVTRIGDLAFYRCTALASVTIPNSLTSIGYNAFESTAITSMTIPNSVTSIGSSAFAYCTALTSITIPNGITTLESFIFGGCTILTSITIPDGVTSIGGGAFSGCKALISITIPNNVTSIERGTFSQCTALTSITIPNSVTSIDEEAFWLCSKLASVTIGYGITYLGNFAFSYSGLTKVSVKAITPIVLYGEPFADIPSSCVLEVPFGSKNLYMAAYGWKNFTTINEIVDPDLASSVVSASVASSTSITINGKITNSSTEDKRANIYFIYGTDPNNLNQSTAMQGGTVPGSGSLNVNTTITGLTNGTLYYYKLIAGGNESTTGKLFLSTSIPASNLALWLRADQALTSSDTSVSGWGDLSGWNNDASQSTSSNQPTITSSAINGYPALSFNGTTSKLTLPTSVSLGIQNNPYELFIVAKSSSSTIQFLLAGGANEQFEYHLNGVVGARFIPVTSVWIDQGTAGAYTNGNAHVFSARASASGGVVRVDGNEVGASGVNTLSSNSGNLLLGARSDDTYYFDGSIAEVIIYNTNLSSEDRNSVEQYLAQRYLIAGMQKPEFTSTSFSTAEDTLFSDLLATDADGDDLSYTILANALNGAAHIATDSLFYQPALNFNGTDSLHIAVSDGAYSDTAWVHITVIPVNDSPVVRDTLVTANTATVITVSLPVSDVDGTISTVFIDRQPNNGEAIISGSSISYTSDAGFTGNDTLTWYAQDNEGAFSDTATLIVNVVPFLPIDLDISDTTITEGTEVCFNAENEITVAGSDSTVVIDNNASVSFIAGSSIRFLPGFRAVEGSYVHGWITNDASFCDALPTAIVAVNPLEEKSLTDEQIPGPGNLVSGMVSMKVYPNPNNGQFTISVSGVGEGQSDIRVYNIHGEKVYSGRIDNLGLNGITLKTITVGLYFVEITSGKEKVSQRIMVK